MDPERLDWIRRNSKVGLDREGRWSMDGRPVEHPRVQKLFHQGVEWRDGEDAPRLKVGKQWCFIQFLEDTAFFVSRLRASGHTLQVTLADDRELEVSPDRLSRRSDEDVYVTLPSGHRARLLRDAVSQLVPLLDEQDGRLGLRLEDRFYPIPAAE